MRLARVTRWLGRRSAVLQRVQRPAMATLMNAARRALSTASGSGSGTATPAGGAGARPDPVAAALAAAEAAQAHEPPHFSLSPRADTGAGRGGAGGSGGAGGLRVSYRGFGGGRGRGGGYGESRGRGGGRSQGRVSAELRVPGMALKTYETATAARAAEDAARASELWDCKRESIESFVARVRPSAAPAIDVFAVAFDPNGAAATATTGAPDAATDGLSRAAYTDAQVRVAHAQLHRGGAAAAAAGAVVDPTPYSAVDAQWRAAISILDEKMLRVSGEELAADAMARIMALSKSTGFADGKWMFFLPSGPDAFTPAAVDAVWHALALATARGFLGSSVKLVKSTKGVLQLMVEVSTPDFTATADVTRVRDAIKRVVKAALAPYNTSAAAAESGPFAGRSERPPERGVHALASESGARLMYKPRIMSFLGVYRDHPYGIRPTTADGRVDFV